MDKFSVAQEVATLLPNMTVVTITAYNINNGAPNPQLTNFIKDTVASTLENLSSYPNAQSHPRIALYRDTLKNKCNLSAKKFPQSNESLFKRVLKEGKAPPPINPLVDFYNTISLKHAVTAGAFDLGMLQTRSIQPLELRMSRIEDTFKALDADEEAKAVNIPAGELVYAQDTTVLTRHLAWRQAAEGLVNEKTHSVVIVSEVLSDPQDQKSIKLAEEVADDFIDGLRRFFGVEGTATILGEPVNRLSVELNNAFF